MFSTLYHLTPLIPFKNDDSRASTVHSVASVNDEYLTNPTPRGSRTTPRHGLEPAHNIPLLPHLPKFSIVVNKSSNQLLGIHQSSTVFERASLKRWDFPGIQVEALAYELCGTLVRCVDPGGAVGRDGRLRPGDLVLFLNHESMWRVTSSQAKIILRRADFVTTGIP